jgi:hypothetical protein
MAKGRRGIAVGEQPVVLPRTQQGNVVAPTGRVGSGRYVQNAPKAPGSRSSKNVVGRT